MSDVAIPAIPPPTWVRFTSRAPNDPASKVERYRVTEHHTRSGAPLTGLAVGSELVRIESTRGVPEGDGDLAGVLLHLGYTRAAERAALVTTEVPGPTATAVVIPITKTNAWWQLAQDERDAIFRGAGRPGHVTVGLPFLRVSVDHGTAFDRAWKGLANHESMVEALDVAVRMLGADR